MMDSSSRIKYYSFAFLSDAPRKIGILTVHEESVAETIPSEAETTTSEDNSADTTVAM